MLKIVWKIISLRKKNPKWETGATQPSAYIGSIS